MTNKVLIGRPNIQIVESQDSHQSILRSHSRRSTSKMTCRCPIMKTVGVMRFSNGIKNLLFNIKLKRQVATTLSMRIWLCLLNTEPSLVSQPCGTLSRSISIHHPSTPLTANNILLSCIWFMLLLQLPMPKKDKPLLMQLSE